MTDKKKLYSGISALVISIIILNVGIFLVATKGSGVAIIILGS